MEKGKKAFLLNIVAFCALMENGGGIVGKSPDYIIEKFKRYVLSQVPNEYLWGLDNVNSSKLLKWITDWNQNSGEIPLDNS